MKIMARPCPILFVIHVLVSIMTLTCIFTIQRVPDACGVQNIPRPKMNENQLNQAVIQLHDIARLIETEIGSGQLSMDLRDCADRLNMLMQPFQKGYENVNS